MKKIAIFVEGLTETIFVFKLIEYYYGYKEGLIIPPPIEIKGKNRIVKAYKEIDAEPAYYVLIYNSGEDRRVVSDILQNADNMLNNQQFNMIIGLRDLYPDSCANLDKIEASIASTLSSIVPNNSVKVHLAVTEIEAWFLADFAVFERIDTALDVNNIQQITNIRIDQVDPEKTINHPAKFIDSIFKSVGKRYRKHRDEIYEIVSKLDLDFLFLEVLDHGKISKFGGLIKSLENI